jgi:hypothetical protein
MSAFGILVLVGLALIPAWTAAKDVNPAGQVQKQEQYQSNDQSEDEVYSVSSTSSLQNQEEEGGISSENESSENESEIKIAEQRRSRVANAIQEMLRVADKNEPFGQQVRIIAQEQKQEHEEMENGLENIDNRGGFLKFLIGNDFKEIKNVQNILVQNRQRVQQLNEIKTQFTNQGDQQKLTEQVSVLEKTNQAVQEQLNQVENRFSLLGWLFKLLSK